MFIKKDDFVTNTSYDCRRTLRKQAQRRDRRVYGNPYIKGPVYVNRMQEPDRGTFSSKTAVDVKKEETLLAKIESFFAAMSASLAELKDVELTPNVHINEADVLLMQSMEDSAIEYETEAAAKEAIKASKKPYQSKRSIKNAEKLAAKRAAEAERAAQKPSILDLKDKVEAEARERIRQKDELKAGVLGHFDSMPEKGAFKYLSADVLNDMNSAELAELLHEIEVQKSYENRAEIIYNRDNWMKTEEYILFANEINVARFLKMLDSSRKDIINQVETDALLEWSNSDNAAKADFRQNGDIVHNWNITNLKFAFLHAYLNACEDGGKLDHDPVLCFPNGTKTNLSRFIGYENFEKIADSNVRTQASFLNASKKAG